MTDLQLYTLVLPGGPQDGLMARLRQQLSTSAVLDQDGGIVESLSSEPGDQTISGYYRGHGADKMKTELEELAQSSGVGEVPMAGMGEATSKDGYYSLESADVEQVAPQTPLVQRFDLTLRYKGGKDDYHRSLETNKRQVAHEFGNSTALEIAAPAAATKVRWYDGESFEIATPVETRSAELGDVDIYDAADSSLDPEIPRLIYEIGYTEEEKADCRIWDSRGHEAKHDADGNLQWGKVFSTQHGFDHTLVLDNGLIRLYLDEQRDQTTTLEATDDDPHTVEAGDVQEYGRADLDGPGALQVDGTLHLSGERGTLWAERWDPGMESWVEVTLPGRNWGLYDVDISEIGMVRDKVQLTFVSGSDLFALDAILHVGRENVQFDIPEGESGPIPDSLERWLEPIASESIVDPNSSKTLVRRSSVRK